MALRSAPPNTVWSFPFTPQDWEHTPAAVRASLRTLPYAPNCRNCTSVWKPWKLA